MLYYIKLDECKCYPNSYRDLIAYNANIPMNFISAECRQLIEQNPQTYDPFVHGQCTNNFNLIYTIVNSLGNNNEITIVNDQKMLTDGLEEF